MGEETTSFVLFPHGPPYTDIGREACTRTIEYLCGRIEQTKEGPIDPNVLGSVIRLLLRATDESSNRGVIVLTQLDDLPLGVVRLRRELSNAHPRLQSMLWIVFVEVERHPFFAESASALGRLDAEMDDVPVWAVRNENQKYLVLTPRSEPMLVKQRARSIIPSSGYFKATASGTSGGLRRPTLEEMAEALRRYGKT